jgi:hypothetical protein
MADLNNLPGGALDGRLADPYSLENNLQQRAALSQMQGPGRVGSLLELDTLLPMLLGGAAAAFGNDDATRMAGGGLATGALMGGLQQPQQFANEQQQRIDKLTAMIEKQQQRMTTLLQSQPGLFVGEDEENIISPERMGYLSGMGLNFDPAAMMKRARATESKQTNLSLADELISIGSAQGNPMAVAQGLRIIAQEQELDWSDDYINELSVMDQTSALARLRDTVSDSSLVKAYKYATDKGLSMSHPDVTSQFENRAYAPDVSVSDQLALEAKSKMDWFQQVWANESPENARLLATNPFAAFETAFANRPADKALIKKIFSSMGEGDELNRLQVKALLDTISLLPEMEALMSKAFGMDPESDDYDTELARLFASVSGGLGMALNTVVGMAAIDQRLTNARRISGAGLKAYSDVVNQGNADSFGLLATQTASRLAQADGKDYGLLPLADRLKYERQAEKLIVEEWRKDLPAGGTTQPTRTEPVMGPDFEQYMSGQGILPPTIEAPTPEETPPLSATEVKQLATKERDVRGSLDALQNLPSSMSLTQADTTAMREVERWLALPEDVRGQVADQPEFQEALGRVTGLARIAITPEEALRVIEDKTRRQALIAELNAMPPTTREKAAALPRYKQALADEWKFRNLSQETIDRAGEYRLQRDRRSNFMGKE